MVTTRRQELNHKLQFTPPPGQEHVAEVGTPRTLTLPDGRQLKSALKTQRCLNLQFREGVESRLLQGENTPRGAAIRRRVRINSGDNMVHVFQSSTATQQGDGGGSDDDAAASAPRRRIIPAAAAWPRLHLSRGVLASFALLAWSAVSSVLIFYNKSIMVDRGFPFPLLLPAISQIGCGVLAWGAGLAGVAPVRPMPPPREILTRLLPLAAAFTLCLSLGNYAYLGLSVAFLNILKAFTPAVTLTISAAFGMERMTPAALASTLIIAVGTGIATLSETATNANFHWPSFISFTTSIVFEGCRVVLTARLLGGMTLPYNPIELLAHIGPMIFVVMSAASFVVEGDQVRALGWQAIVDLLPAFFWVSVLSFLVNLTSYYAIQLTSSTTFKVVGSFKNAAVVWAGVMLGDLVTVRQVQGFALSIAGFVMFTVVRGGMQQKAAAAAGGGRTGR